jgi:hypothetical protein
VFIFCIISLLFTALKYNIQKVINNKIINPNSLCNMNKIFLVLLLLLLFHLTQQKIVRRHSETMAEIPHKLDPSVKKFPKLAVFDLGKYTTT